MWKSQVQNNWEKSAKKIGIKIKKDKKVNVFIDYWELPFQSKVENLEEEYPSYYIIKFYKK